MNFWNGSCATTWSNLKWQKLQIYLREKAVMVVCLVSPHTRDDTTKRWPRNGTVGPEIAIFTTILGIGSKFLPKNSSQQISPTPGAPSPSFWRAGSRARPTPSWLLFFWAAQKTGRSQGEKFRGELSPRPRDTAGRHSCVSWLSQPVGNWAFPDQNWKFTTHSYQLN